MDINGFENLNAALFGWSDGDDQEAKEAAAEAKRLAEIEARRKSLEEFNRPCNELRRAADKPRVNGGAAAVAERILLQTWYIRLLRDGCPLAMAWAIAEIIPNRHDAIWGIDDHPLLGMIPNIPRWLEFKLNPHMDKIRKVLLAKYPPLADYLSKDELNAYKTI